MASSFDQTFAPNFLQGLAPNQAPDPAIIPGVQPAAVGPADYAAWLQQNRIPDSAEAFQQFQSMNGQPAPENAMQAAAPAAPVDPMQAAPENAMQAAAPAAPVDPGAPGQPNLGQPGPMPGMAMPAHGERKSFASVLQSLSDKANMAFGAPTTAQQQQAHQLALQSANLKNLGQNLENTGTGLDNQTKAGVLLHGFFNGLKSIQANGGDPTVAAPILAQQLGIPEQQAQHIIESIKADPNNLDALAEATDVQKGGSASKALALAYTTAIGPDGQPVFLQAGSDGKPHPIEGYRPILGTTNTDTGAEVITRDKTGKVVDRVVKQGGPATGEGAITDGGGKVVGYRPLPGSTAATNQRKTEAEIEAIKNKGKTPPPGKATAAKTDPAQAMGILDNIEAGFRDLHRMGALAGDPGNGIEQAGSAIGRTKIGQAIGAQFGNAAAQKRLELNKNVNLLQQELIKALPASATRSKFEQEILKASLPDPSQMSFETAGRVIAQYREIYSRAVREAAAKPSALPPRTPKPAASGGWGKAQVIQ